MHQKERTFKLLSGWPRLYQGQAQKVRKQSLFMGVSEPLNHFQFSRLRSEKLVLAVLAQSKQNMSFKDFSGPWSTPRKIDEKTHDYIDYLIARTYTHKMRWIHITLGPDGHGRIQASNQNNE